jgi:hypothetical protein
MEIEEAGEESFAAGVEARRVRGGEIRADGDDAAVRDQDIDLTRGRAGAVDDGCVLNQDALRRKEAGAEQENA